MENTAHLWTVVAVKLGNVKTGQLKLLPDLCGCEGWYCLFLDQLHGKRKRGKQNKTKQKYSRWTRMSRSAVWRLLSTRASWHLSFQVYSPVKASKESSDFIYLTFNLFFFQNEKSHLAFGKPSQRREQGFAWRAEEETIMPVLGSGSLTYASRIGRIPSFA